MTGSGPLKKYRELEQALKAEIEAGVWKPGDQLPAGLDLARRYSVAPMTVRQAITTLVDDGILVRIHGKGTFVVDPAQSAARAGTRHPITLIFHDNWQRRDPHYFTELLDGFKLGIESAGLRMNRYDYDVVAESDVLTPGSAVAVPLLEQGHLDIIEKLKDKGHRVLAINHYTGRRAIPSVRIDDGTGIDQAVSHLVALGHERIGFIRGILDNLDAIDRLQTFRSVAKRLGLRYAPEAGDGFIETAGYAAAQTMLSAANSPTAFVCASDLSAIGAMRAVRDRGLSVPHDVSIVGFGDFSVADFVMPRLTTIRQNRSALGQVAAGMLIRIANDEDVDDMLLDAELIIRESTTRIRTHVPATI